MDFNKIRFPRTHDIGDLIDLLKDSGIEISPEFETLVDLTDYAVEGRYSMINDDLDNIDKYIVIIEDLLKISEGIINSSKSP